MASVIPGFAMAAKAPRPTMATQAPRSAMGPRKGLRPGGLLSPNSAPWGLQSPNLNGVHTLISDSF